MAILLILLAVIGIGYLGVKIIIGGTNKGEEEKKDQQSATSQLKAIKALLIIICAVVVLFVTNPNNLEDYGYNESERYVKVKSYGIFSVLMESYGGRRSVYDNAYVDSKWREAGFGILGLTFGGKEE